MVGCGQRAGLDDGSQVTAQQAAKTQCACSTGSGGKEEAGYTSLSRVESALCSRASLCQNQIQFPTADK